MEPSFPRSVQASVYSGMMCIRQMARNTPPAKALAIPNIFGLSLKDLLLTGTMPISKASRKDVIMKATLSVSVLSQALDKSSDLL